MKKWISIALCLVLMMTLTGCMGNGKVKLPAVMSDGSEWDNSWVCMGGRIGVEKPEGELLLLTTNGEIDDMDFYYATWIGGEETELDKDTYVYDCQLYLMIEDCGISEDAYDTKSLWREQIGGDFEVTEERQFSAAGVDFTLVFYNCLSADTHFDSGVTALGVWRNQVIVADLGKVDTYDMDLAAEMEDFLNGFHYA